MLSLTERAVVGMRIEGEKAFPGECCGVLLGRDEDITEILPLENAREQEERYHRFRIEPDDLLRAEKTARERGLDVLGFYHSHPDAPAKPSEYDREHALPFYVYLILSVRGGAAEELAAWSLSMDRAGFGPVEYVVV